VSVADPGYGAFLTSGFGIRIRDQRWEKNPDPDLGFGKNIPDHFSESLKTVFFCYKYLNSLMQIQDPGSGMEKFASGIRDSECRAL
jgi:hypothetical protein